MATGNTKRPGGRPKGTKNTKRSSTARRTETRNQNEVLDYSISSEVSLILFAAITVFLFLCNFGVCGSFGNVLSGVLFGIFGITAYIIPLVIFASSALLLSNGTSPAALRKVISGLVLLLVIAMLLELVTGRVQGMVSFDGAGLYSAASEARNGGGFIAGSIAYFLYHNLSLAGTLIVMLVVFLIAAGLFTQKSVVRSMKKGGRRVIEKTRQGAQEYREYMDERARFREEERARIEEERQLLLEQKEDEKILRMDKKVSGVSMDTRITNEDEADIDEFEGPEIHLLEGDRFEEDDHPLIEDLESSHSVFIPEEEIHDDIHEIRYNPDIVTEEGADGQFTLKADKIAADDTHKIELTIDSQDDYQEEEHIIDTYAESYEEEEEESFEPEITSPLMPKRPVARLAKEAEEKPFEDAEIPIHAENFAPDYNGEYKVHSTDYVKSKKSEERMQQAKERSVVRPPAKKYEFPPIKLLTKGVKGKGDSESYLRNTAKTLEETLAMFNVVAKITHISQGPSVTRYELQPEAGVKVRKIVDLSDDIKMHLAATDIRIEAPIPGKSAVGIEVPNKENSPVAVRDLIDSEEFKKSKSNLTVAVGKDIAGKIVVTDIAKMPHLLIAGATGSGKSVCINTIIMSIIYKADPEDVRLIMIDPKIVELSVYNGIPHLLIPVVTDPKKAAAALNWAVAEMTNRYKKFANAKVRDLKGYNALCAQSNDEEMQKLPEIVVIVDELADLMMQFKNEVEDSIVRLTQLARAAGIYLIIATQRPSVDVITGLIKANIPSRIAFAVSSGVDSRTILDSYGAEKLIGKGDMLFFPRGYNKPARVQGCFVSDEEVQAVTDFIKNQNVETEYGGNVQDELSSYEVASKSAPASTGDSADSGSDVDPLFAQAGAAIIEKEKASIGMLQRLYKIGFNRAARIMDQLSDAGVVGPEEGTKPRKILMTKEEFEQFMESNAS
ncbi:FtsK/SpoIIIE family DNA translocase [Butyrivibrio sp. WCD3002]|uniref:FtsK/SpoIIIE family DNA translocase n=1 Tax=Butyrivibrio sp. WCD3002 TaxID=1280676 RepID=UPI000478D1E4|nr:DNA translocase FtsK [Butyrivibrio sp. WCD3002]